MPAMCPHCDTPLKKHGASKRIKATEYYCVECGQIWTKVAGEKGYHKGQITTLPQEYFNKG